MIKIHANEPTLDELKVISADLFKADSTDLNVRKLKALECQIGRHKALEAEQKAEAKAKEKASAEE